MLHLDKVAEVRLKSDSDIYQFLGMQSNKSEALRLGLKLLISQYGMKDVTNPYGDEFSKKSANVSASQDKNFKKRKKPKTKADNTAQKPAVKKQEQFLPDTEPLTKELDTTKKSNSSNDSSTLNGLDFFNENWHQEYTANTI